MVFPWIAGGTVAARLRWLATHILTTVDPPTIYFHHLSKAMSDLAEDERMMAEVREMAELALERFLIDDPAHFHPEGTKP